MADFLFEQNKIHDTIRGGMSEARKTGLRPDPMLQESKNGAAVILRLHPRIVESLALRAREIGTVVPGPVYGAKDFHATLGRILHYNNARAEKNTVLKKLVEVVHKMRPHTKDIWCNHQDYLFNQVSVIRCGSPNQSFLNASNSCIASAQALGVPLIHSWGAHTTLARFTRYSSPEHAEHIYNLLQRAKIDDPHGWFRCTAVAVVWLSTDPDGFMLEVVEQFPL